jgi:ankyrin repeat protein
MKEELEKAYKAKDVERLEFLIAIESADILLLDENVREEVLLMLMHKNNSALVEKILQRYSNLPNPEKSAKIFLIKVWIELLLAATRNPTRKDLKKVDVFKHKYADFFASENIFNALYELAEPYLSSRFEILPNELKLRVWRNVPAGTSGRVSKEWRETLYEEKFKRHFPKRYKQLMAEGPFKKNWFELFVETCEEAYGKLSPVQRELLLAIKEKDLEKIKTMIKEKRITGKDLAITDSVENVWGIHFAAQNGFQSACDEIYKNLIIPLTQDPLMDPEGLIMLRLEGAIAAQQSIDTIRETAAGADFAISSDRVVRVLADFCAVIQLVTIKYLVPLLGESYYETLLSKAYDVGRLDIVKLLTDELKLVTEREVMTVIRLREACENDQLEIVKYLVEKKGANIQDSVLLACDKGSLEVVKYFVERAETLKSPLDLNLLLEHALKNYKHGFHRSVIRFLIEKGADPLKLIGEALWGHTAKEIIESFDPSGPVPLFVIKIFDSIIKGIPDNDTSQVAVAFRNLYAASQNPTKENLDKLETEEFKTVFSNHDLKQIYSLAEPFLKRDTNPVFEVTAREAQQKATQQEEMPQEYKNRLMMLEGRDAAEARLQHCIKPITLKNIDTLSETELLKILWAELLFSAIRKPTAGSWKKVHDFKNKYADSYNAEKFFEDLYQLTEPFLSSRLETLPFEAKALVLKKLDDKSVGVLSVLSREWLAFIEQHGDWEKRFRDFFPREYRQMMPLEEEIDWRKVFVAKFTRHPMVRHIFNKDKAKVFFAIGRKDVKELKGLLAHGDINFYSNDGMDLLLRASLNGFREGCAAIWDTVKNNVDPSRVLLWAICTHQPRAEIVRCIELNAQINKQVLDRDPRSPLVEGEEVFPLLLACECDHGEAVQVLLDSGVDTEKLLPIACAQGNINTVRLLVEKQDADVNEVTKNKESKLISVLWLALIHGHFPVVEYLIDHGAKFDVDKCFMCACMSGYLNLAAYFFKKGADLNKKDKGGFSPLLRACGTNCLNIMRFLVEKGADVVPLYEQLSNVDVDRKDFLKSLKEDGPGLLVVMLNKQIEQLRSKKHSAKPVSLLFTEHELPAAICLLKALEEPTAENLAELKTHKSVLFTEGALGATYQLCLPFLKPDVKSTIQHRHG